MRRLQLWSYNFDPEPTGIGPVSTGLALLLRERGWAVDVVAAHPHYPEPIWGRRLLPYREVRDGIRVLRLPIWVGRQSAGARMRQEISHLTALFAALPAIGRPILGRPDLILSSSPSFPALLPAMVSAATRRIPWALWLHDMLPDGAVATGLLDGGPVLQASRWLERTAYRRADGIIVLSEPFLRAVTSKGIPESKVRLIYDPATRGIPRQVQAPSERRAPATILSMGNIGHSQGLAPLVAAWERSAEVGESGATLVITGNGVAADAVAAEVRSSRVRMLGLVEDEQLDHELNRASLALVSQSYEGTEFNLPSKLMNFMAYGLPVIAAVNPAGEVARIVREAEAGWVCGSSEPDSMPRAVMAALSDPTELDRRASNSRRYAEERFSPQTFGDAFDRSLRKLLKR